MKILVDKAMPYWSEFFNSLGEVVTFTAGDLALDASLQVHNSSFEQHLSNTECLLVRSTTKISDALLAKMPMLRFVATATAGYDHLDISALETRQIEWYAAGGCNAQAVTQYIICALLTLATTDNFLIKEKVVAVVGHGNVGCKVAKAARALGAKVIVYDPPQQAENNASTVQGLANNIADNILIPYVNFEDVLCADIICIHAPYNSHPLFSTKHLFNEKVLSTLTNKQYLINAGRGELIDNNALLALLDNNRLKGLASVNVVLDVWEHEPNIMVSLIPMLRLASAHIAGHSLEGRANGTSMIYKALCKLLQVEESIELSALLPLYDAQLPTPIYETINKHSQLDEYQIQDSLNNLCQFVYDIQNDDSVFRHHMSQFTSFVKIRQEYPVRREFSALNLIVPNTKINELLRGIGFIISNDSTPQYLIK